MNLKTIFLILFCLVNFTVVSQDKSKLIEVDLSGFVRTDFMLDTRQIVAAREGQFLLYPQDVKLDPDGIDINKRANFNYLAIISRAKLTLTGPQVWNANTTGVLEGDFFGQQEFLISGFRLRNAFIKLNWEHLEILTGRYWHPMFILEIFPKTVSFNTGVPFNWLSRNGQIRITYKSNKFKILGAVVTQRDFASPGGPDALRNSLLPDLQGQIQYAPVDDLLMGVSLGYKQLLPRLETDSGYSTRSMVRGFTSNAFIKYQPEKFTITAYGSLLENGFDGLALGGYAIRAITDRDENRLEYTTLNTATLWSEIYTSGNPFELGLFAGYSKNLGASESIENLAEIETYSRGASIAYVYRISPRVVYRNKNFQIGTELESTTAAYGKSFSAKAIPQNVEHVTNLRVLVSVLYNF